MRAIPTTTRQSHGMITSVAKHAGGRQRELQANMVQAKRKQQSQPRSKRKPKGAGLERRAEILAAAKELFASEGFARVTTRALAEKVGLSQTGLYIYFPTKEDILRAISDETHNALTDAFDDAAAQGGTPRAVLRRLIRAYVEFGLAHPADYQLTFSVSAEALAPIEKDFSKPFDTQDPGARNFLRFRDHLAALTPTGRLGGLDPMIVAQILWLVGHGAVSLLISRSHFPWAERETLITGLENMVLNGLLGPEVG